MNNWQKTVVDSEGMVGYCSSLKLFPTDVAGTQGEPAISYTSGEPYNDLRFAWRDASGLWHVCLVGDSRAGGYEYTSLAFLPASHPQFPGQPVFAYREGYPPGKMCFAWHTGDDLGTGWQHVTVDDQSAAGSWPNLTILPSGQPAISYNRYWSADIMYAWHEGGDFADPASWQKQIVDDEGGQWTSIAMLPTGRPAISYYNYDLRFAEGPVIDDPCDGWVNLYRECNGRPYATWHLTYQDWGVERWEFDTEVELAADSPYLLSGVRDFPIDLQVNGQSLLYEGNGVWRVGETDATATFVSADRYQLVSPSWDWVYCPPLQPSLPYPCISLGTLRPGEKKTYHWRFDWVNQPAWSSALFCGEDFGYALRGVAIGDLNCDGAVDFADINPFVKALVGQVAYEAAYPSCDWRTGDIDGNGQVDFDDINPFVKCLVGGACP